MGWSRPGLPLLSSVAGPVQHFRTADLCDREGFRCGSLLDIFGSLQLLNSTYVRERDKVLLRSVMVGGIWNCFLLGKVRVSLFLVDGHLFW